MLIILDYLIKEFEIRIIHNSDYGSKYKNFQEFLRNFHYLMILKAIGNLFVDIMSGLKTKMNVKKF